MAKFAVRIFKEVSDMNNPAKAQLEIITTKGTRESLVGGWYVEGKTVSYLFPKDTLMTVTEVKE